MPHVTQEPMPGDPGYSRDIDLERDRGTRRPAEAHLDGHPNEGRPIHFAPDPDDPDGGGFHHD